MPRKAVNKKQLQKDKLLLKYQYEALKKCKTSESARSWKKFYETTILDPTKTMYEKYKKMYQGVQDKSEKAFQQIEEEKNDDPFFLDPDNEDDKRKLNDSKQVITTVMKEQKLDAHNASGFAPYEDLGFWSRDSGYQVFAPRNFQEKVDSKKSSIPAPNIQAKLDPKNWKSNVNFVPIPEQNNKLKQLLAKKQQQQQEANNQTFNEKEENLKKKVEALKHDSHVNEDDANDGNAENQAVNNAKLEAVKNNQEANKRNNNSSSNIQTKKISKEKVNIKEFAKPTLTTEERRKQKKQRKKLEKKRAKGAQNSEASDEKSSTFAKRAKK